ncbi:MAG: Fur family transcriptional regulator [Candidatus Caenarcaniphilales bacterium]|nr:Fur family transcriptional regulator [Candidatus Caenarcaniphilales bacterium]
MMVEKILTKLKQKGYRRSKLREAVISVLQKSQSPLSVTDLIEALSQRDLIRNKTSIYRELETLLQEKVIHELDLMDGKKRYEILPEGEDHHHHLICRLCGSIQCFDLADDLRSLEKQIHEQKKFLVQSHVLEFFGRCESCQRGLES